MARYISRAILFSFVRLAFSFLLIFSLELGQRLIPFLSTFTFFSAAFRFFFFFRHRVVSIAFFAVVRVDFFSFRGALAALRPFSRATASRFGRARTKRLTRNQRGEKKKVVVVSSRPVPNHSVIRHSTQFTRTRSFFARVLLLVHIFRVATRLVRVRVFLLPQRQIDEYERISFI